MRIYLAGIEILINRVQSVITASPQKIYALSSFFYARSKEAYDELIPYFKDFLLDSGAFTFIQSQNQHQDWDGYLEEYAEYINRLDIKKYFELDIDAVVGYEKVKEFRARLEKATNRPCIPVWHKSRGKEEFLRLCEEYSTVAVGGIAVKHIRQDEYKYFPWLISEAHKRGCQLHALGFTNLEMLKRFHFDSVDSTSWTSGGRYGTTYRFNGRGLTTIGQRPGRRVRDSRNLDKYNFIEWVKFQQYALTHL